MSTKQKQSEASIQTFLRIRPSKSPSGYFAPDDLEKDSVNVALPDNYHDDYINNSKLRYSFHFNGVIDMKASQEDVFQKVGSAAVKSALEGFNSTIFAYGQTGSGKTFTLTGGPEKYSDRGIIPRTISTLFQEFRQRADMQFKMFVSYLEIYNEHGYDILDPSQDSKSLEDLPKVTILEDEHGNYHLKNLSMHSAETEEEALNLLFLGDANRAIAETPMNMASSRSHCIFSISLESRAVGSDKIRRSKLHLVDLAGSERVGKTNSSGSVLTEAKYINSSLFFLEMVIVALHEKATKGRTHIPYRNSMMTSVLRDSLGGNCKTIMIATINPEASHTEESLSTCRFAQRVSLIKNRATINEEMDPGQIIKRLKAEILNLREEINFLKGDSGDGEELSTEDVDDIKRSCQEYCLDGNPDADLALGSLTLSRIKTAFSSLKALVREKTEGKSESSEVGNHHDIKQISDGSQSHDLLLQQVKDLKSLLTQRDSEINILVNMVKKGKHVEDDDADAKSIIKETSEALTSKNTGKRLKTPVEASSKKDKNEVLIQRHLFGVPPPADVSVFEDAAASFEWFRERCSLNDSINENKDLLKSKISEAKLVGERANQSRNTITYLKNTIESVRKERALQQLSAGHELEAESETPEETTYRRAIEQEKTIYKESFDKLKVLKPEIEHIRKMVEKCRATLQSQFDQWYENLHSRGAEKLLKFDDTVVQAKEEQTQKVNASLSRDADCKSDNDVNDDIMAFYQAKEELLKRRR